jgi:CRISPR/Cas system CMR-associated protein Cmr5 small subunit
MQTIDQKCAENAYKAYCELNQLPEKDKVFGFAKKMPMMIMASGLGNAIMFKLKDDIKLVKCLLKWLFPNEKFDIQMDDREKIEQIVSGKLLNSMDSLRINTVKTLKWLEWFNRFADASETSDNKD